MTLPAKPTTLPIQSYFPNGEDHSKNSDVGGEEATSNGGKETSILENITWQPEREYAEIQIASIIPGPQCVTIMGRIANFYDQPSPGKKPQSARGCVKMIVKDDTGGLTVRLWYASVAYSLKLGQLVKFWATHISCVTDRRLTAETAPLFASIFPERDRCCYFTTLETSDNNTRYKTPLGYLQNQQLSGLITLKEFIDGAYETYNSRILVIVKSIGVKKSVKKKEQGGTTLVTAVIMDNTNEASIVLWGNVVYSADSWRPSETVLLITNGKCKTDHGISIALAPGSFVDINPNIPEASVLRKWAQGLKKREHVNPQYPEGVFDLETALNAPIRPLYTLAEMDQFARTNPTEAFTGFLSLLILDLKVSTLHRRGMLFSNECCDTPLYANTTSARCKQCQTTVTLRINPHAIGSLADETACIESSKLVWSPSAWTEMLGRTAEQLATTSEDVLQYLDVRLLFLRVTIVVGWPGQGNTNDSTGGKLFVLAVLT